MTGISPSHIVRLENGESVPTLETLCKIATALKVPPFLLFTCKERRNGNMKNRQEIVTEILEVLNELSMFGLLKALWFVRHFRKMEK